MFRLKILILKEILLKKILLNKNKKVISKEKVKCC